MATVEKIRLRGERRIALSGIPWEVYERLRENEQNRHVRMAYDDGRLELMSPSPDHEAIKELICDMTSSITIEFVAAATSIWPSIRRRTSPLKRKPAAA